MLEDAKFIDEKYEQSQNRTWGIGFTMGSVSYATSLFWQPLQNVDDPFSDVQEASVGVLEGADLFCIKTGKAPQFGICASTEGFVKGKTVAAVALSSALGAIPSFIAVFKVEGGWWYTCVRNDIILSDGDMLFLDELDARAQFESMLAVPDWGKKIAPLEWGMEGVEQLELATLLAKGSKAKLQRINALRGTKLFLVFGISAVLGFWILSSLFTSIFLAPPKKPTIVSVAPKIIKPVERAPEKKPWESVVDSEAVLNNCYEKSMALVGIMPPGWEIGDLKCSSSAVSTAWGRNVGQLAWIQKALEESGVPFSSISYSDTGQQVSASVAFGKITNKASPPEKNSIDLKKDLNNLFQSLGLTISLSDQSFTSPDKNVYKSVAFRFSSTQNPVIWQKILMNFSGLVINNITYNPKEKIWNYEGAIYAL